MKNIIITGTSRGIGHELALQFAKAGHQVLAISRKIPQTLLVNKNITCLSVDLSNEMQLAKVTDFVSNSWKQIDAIIHNAGSLILKPFSETTQVISDIIDRTVQGAQRNRELLDTRIAETQRSLELETELYKAGYASNVAAKQKELAELA